MTNQKMQLTSSETRTLLSDVNRLKNSNNFKQEVRLIGLRLYTKSQVNRLFERILNSLQKGYLTTDQLFKLYNYKDIVYKRDIQKLTRVELILHKLWKQVTDKNSGTI